MLGLMFSALVIIALLCTAFHTAMRIRLMRIDTARDRRRDNMTGHSIKSVRRSKWMRTTLRHGRRSG